MVTASAAAYDKVTALLRLPRAPRRPAHRTLVSGCCVVLFTERDNNEGTAPWLADPRDGRRRQTSSDDVVGASAPAPVYSFRPLRRRPVLV